MNKKLTGLIIPIALIIAWSFLIDYSDFFSGANLAAFLGILTMVLLILGYFRGKKY